jgi:hypothetical protein
MAKSSPEKLAAALRANLKRRKLGPTGPKGPEDGRAAKRAQGPEDGRAAKRAQEGPPPNTPQKPPKNSA